MRQKAFRLLALLFAVLLLGACAGLPRTAGIERSAAAAFDVAGRFSVHDGNRGFAAHFDWQHRQDRDEWRFLSPLGQVLARLQRDAGGARLETADGRVQQHPSADVLIASLLGIELPLASLPGWLQAVPVEPARVAEHDPVGRPRVIEQHGWRIEYRSYQDETPTALPQRLEAEWGQSRLSLLVDDWHVLSDRASGVVGAGR